MSKEMVISANPHETRVAILEEGQLCEYYVERDKEFALVGSIYKGLDSDAFLYVSDFLEEIEGLDHVETAADDKLAKPVGNGGAGVTSAHVPVPGLETPVGSEASSPAEGHEPGQQVAGGEAAGYAAPISAPPPSFVRPAPPANRGGYQSRPGSGGSGGGDRKS